MEKLDHKGTALVVIDLQKGIASKNRNLHPYSAAEVIKNASSLARACRKNSIPIFLVHVKPSTKTALRVQSDSRLSMQNPPKDWADFVPEMTPENDDIVITKHQWGAFYGTGLDMHLRRRGIKTIILCGISTNIGVESTARFAYEYGYEQVFAEDAMTAIDETAHKVSVESIFRRIGRVRNTSEIIESLS